MFFTCQSDRSGVERYAWLLLGRESLDLANLRGDEIGEGARRRFRGPTGGQDHMDIGCPDLPIR
jgi:hypothetical protein